MSLALSHSGPITAADYRRLFPEIAVGLNWERFGAEGWPVERRVLTSREELLGFYTFFRHSLGRVMPHFLHWLASRQMRVGEVVAQIERIPTKHRHSIDEFVAQWRDATEPLAMNLPTYRFSPNQEFILDGNHRACAIALSGRPFCLQLFTIVGPRERDALVDVASCR